MPLISVGSTDSAYFNNDTDYKSKIQQMVLKCFLQFCTNCHGYESCDFMTIIWPAYVHDIHFHKVIML